MGRKIRLRRKKAGETLEQWTARIERRNKRHDWKLIRDDEDEGGWNFRLSIKGISQRNKRLRRKGVRAGLKFDEDTDITDADLHGEIRQWRIKQRKVRSERRSKLRIVRKTEVSDQRTLRITRRSSRREKRKILRIERRGQTIVQWRIRNQRRLRRRQWKLQRENESVNHWKLRLEKKRTKQRKKRLRFRQKAGILNLFGNEDDITDESSSSGDSDNSESDLETDLDVDICSNSNDESDGLDITDTSLPQEIREWRIKQRKLRSERRIKLRAIWKTETKEQRKIKIGWRTRRRTMRTKLRLSRKTETLVQW